ncbi:hypothetical protein Vafri_13358, partial [Volvox africanus]
MQQPSIGWVQLCGLPLLLFLLVRTHAGSPLASMTPTAAGRLPDSTRLALQGRRIQTQQEIQVQIHKRKIHGTMYEKVSSLHTSQRQPPIRWNRSGNKVGVLDPDLGHNLDPSLNRSIHAGPVLSYRDLLQTATHGSDATTHESKGRAPSATSASYHSQLQHPPFTASNFLTVPFWQSVWTWINTTLTTKHINRKPQPTSPTTAPPKHPAQLPNRGSMASGRVLLQNSATASTASRLGSRPGSQLAEGGQLTGGGSGQISRDQGSEYDSYDSEYDSQGDLVPYTYRNFEPPSDIVGGANGSRSGRAAAVAWRRVSIDDSAIGAQMARLLDLLNQAAEVAPRIGSFSNATTAAVGGFEIQRRAASTELQERPDRTDGFYTAGTASVDPDVAAGLSTGFSVSVAEDISIAGAPTINLGAAGSTLVVGNTSTRGPGDAATRALSGGLTLAGDQAVPTLTVSTTGPITTFRGGRRRTGTSSQNAASGEATGQASDIRVASFSLAAVAPSANQSQAQQQLLQQQQQELLRREIPRFATMQQRALAGFPEALRRDWQRKQVETQQQMEERRRKMDERLQQ